MTTATKAPPKKQQHVYKVGERIDVSVQLEAGDVEIDNLNEQLYAKQINEAEWKAEVTKRLAKKGLQYGEFDAVISNSGTDRHGESILLEGIDISHMKNNAPMPWSHEYANLPLGKWLKIWKSGGNLMGRGRMDYDIYDFADLAYKMLLRGSLNAISIGGLVTELDEQDYAVIKKMQMVEASVVMVGAHPDALVVSRSLNMPEQKFKQAYETFLAEASVDKLKRLGQDDNRQAIKVLKNLLAALEDAAEAVSLEGKDEPENIRRIKHVTLARAAKAVATQSQTVIKTVKLKLKG